MYLLILFGVIYTVASIGLAGAAGFLMRASSLTAEDWIVLSTPTVVLFVLYTWHTRGRALTIQDSVAIIIMTALVPLGLLAVFRIDYSAQNTLALACVAAVLFCILTTHLISQSNVRKTHTMNALLNIRNSSEYLKHFRNVLANYPIGQKIPTADVESLRNARYRGGETIPVWDSVLYIANYHEFICAGYFTNDFDRRLIDETYSNIFVNFYNHVEPILSRAAENNPGYLNIRPFSHYTRFRDLYAARFPSDELK